MPLAAVLLLPACSTSLCAIDRLPLTAPCARCPLRPAPKVFVELQAAAERLGHDLAAARLYFSPRRREQMERLVREAFERPEQVRAPVRTSRVHTA